MVPHGKGNRMNRRTFLKTAGGAATLALGGSGGAWAQAPKHPNIVYILADDMGYGDLSCLNPESKIPTPNMDRIAREGIAFTDAHSGSAVCTPTRYGILTGRYSWRSTLKKGVLQGYSPALIPPERTTAASFLKPHGYRSACVGKWHLGLNWATKNKGKAAAGNVDYTKPVADGPCALGFDYFFGIPASLDMTPYVYVENDRVVEAPTDTIAEQKGMGFYRGGPIAPDFKHIGVLPDLTEKAVEVIDGHAANHADAPLFLYFPLPAPHTPILPTPEFEGTSKAGTYGDFVCQVDGTVGKILDALDRNGMADNTLIVLTSDNGCSPMAQFAELRKMGHEPSYHFRGHKADIFEGGHRIPFLARWPDRIQAGATCDHTVCLTDLLATAADIVAAPLPDNAGEDSVSLLPALLGEAAKPAREAVVHHSINGSFAIRQGRWKLEFCPGSGGWSAPRPDAAKKQGLPKIQLYDLESDIAEKTNVYEQHPELVERLTALLEQYIDQGRSTPGKPQQNKGRTSLWGPKGK